MKKAFKISNFIVCTIYLNIEGVNKSRRFLWTRHVVRREECKSTFQDFIKLQEDINRRLGRE